MTLRLDAPAAAREHCAATRDKGTRWGFVPTMGALHEGHLALVRRAKRECGTVCVSVFINPLQFNDPRDLERYPRDFEGDVRLLSSAGCDMVFTGTLEQFFPEAQGAPQAIRSVDPGPAALGLEGALRPGHFTGVATIVERLFDFVRPECAYFGAKDYQQTLVVRHVARVRGGPRIVVCPTERAPDGLALSSRNALLEPSWRERAPAIHRALLAAREAWRGESLRAAPELARRMHAVLAQSGLSVEYAALRDPEAWTEADPRGALSRAVALIAARAGGVRLIDNLRLDAE